MVFYINLNITSKLAFLMVLIYYWIYFTISYKNVSSYIFICNNIMYFTQRFFFNSVCDDEVSCFVAVLKCDE